MNPEAHNDLRVLAVLALLALIAFAVQTWRLRPRKPLAPTNSEGPALACRPFNPSAKEEQ